jgi:sterol desaturase/sphingolipid hydroxylase (fatty acid hydroxylase superfamily)
MLETRFFVELAIFYVLIILNILVLKKTFPFITKNKNDWIIDVSGLLIQGFFIPLVGAVLLGHFYRLVIPSLESSWDVSPIIGFLLSFAVVDYVYYWVHRILHKAKFWFLHAVHHSAQEMDIINTSRNSLISHFFLPYIWLNSIFIYLLKDPTPFIVAFSITAMLDLWRHSNLYPSESKNILFKTIDWVLITPRSHSWHHSRNQFKSFYGANLAIWDHLHGSYKKELLASYPDRVGIPMNKSLKDMLLTPWQLYKSKKDASL